MTWRTDWIVSSREWTTETPTIEGSPAPVTAPAGALYLIHPTTTLDMLQRLLVAMAGAGVLDPFAFVTEDRHVRLTSSATFTIVWGAATTLRDLLGFTGDLAGSAAYTAPLRSTLLWSPAKRFTPELAPLDTHGAPVFDMSATFGPQGFSTVRIEGSPTTKQTYTARHVAIERYWDKPSKPGCGPGEYACFWFAELASNQKWILMREVIEGASATNSAQYSGKIGLGPYHYDLTDRKQRTFKLRRAQGFETVEKLYDVTIAAIQTDEYQ